MQGKPYLMVKDQISDKANSIKYTIFLRDSAITVIPPSINPMAPPSLSGNNQINKPIKGLSLSIYSTVAFALLALGYGLWPDAGQNGLKKDADTILRGVPAQPAPLNTAVTTNSSPHRGAVTLADSNPVVVDPQGAAQSIVAHGQDLQEENRKIRASLAAGDISALPDSLKVADLPLSTPPPRPVASRSGP